MSNKKWSEVTSCPLSPLTTWKIKTLTLKKKHLEILSFYTFAPIWQSYDVWFLRYGVRQTYFFIILDHFLPFYPLGTQKINILKKWKTHLKILSFYKCVPKMRVIWCMVPEKWSGTDIIFCHFGLFCALLLPLTTQKIKILKNGRNSLEILPFYTCVP